MELLIPILGVLTGMVVPIAVFVWLYFESKNKRDSVIEIAKNLDNPEQVEKLIAIFDERKKEPIDFRRGGLITMFVGIGIFLLGYVALGSVFNGIGLLVGAIGLGTLLAGYLYPNTSEELTNAVEEFEKR
tara:strand:+ start:363 stop:752 length:390 start_codon:yes stop_codon:yes gene_type:complete